MKNEAFNAVIKKRKKTGGAIYGEKRNLYLKLNKVDIRPKSQAVLRTKGRKPQFSGLSGLSISDSIQPYKKTTRQLLQDNNSLVLCSGQMMPHYGQKFRFLTKNIKTKSFSPPISQYFKGVTHLMQHKFVAPCSTVTHQTAK